MQYRLSLPKSLDALRVFEAAARHRSFSRAAEELLVTQAAVSRRIAGLEAELGVTLFTRAGRRIALSEPGERLAASVATALDYLDAEIAPLTDRAPDRAVTIAASTSVSHLWLAPRLRALAAAGAGALRVLTTDSVGEAAERGNDLTILYGRGSHPDWDLTPLLRERLQPVASPDYLARAGVADAAALDLGEIAALDLMDYAQVRPQWVTLAAWMARMGHPVPGLRPGFSSYIMAVEAAERGEGVILGTLDLLDQQLASGALVALGGEVLDTGMGYHLGLRRAPAPPEGAVRLLAALHAAATPRPL